MSTKFYCDMCGKELVNVHATRAKEYHFKMGEGRSFNVKANTTHDLCEPCTRRVVMEGKCLYQ